MHPSAPHPTANGVAPSPPAAGTPGSTGHASSSSESPQPGSGSASTTQYTQGQYSSNPYSTFTTDDEFWASLALNSPDQLSAPGAAGTGGTTGTGTGTGLGQGGISETQSSALALDAAFDALNSSGFASSTGYDLSQTTPGLTTTNSGGTQGAAEADFFAQDIEQILAEATNVAPSAWQQLEGAIGVPSHAGSHYSLDLGGFSQASANSVPFSTQLFGSQPLQQQPQAYQGSVHGSTYFNTTGSAFNFPRAVPTFSVYSGHDETHSVYSETSAYVSNAGQQSAQQQQPSIFQNPGSPTYAINTLPEELDMSHFGLSAPRSAYGGTNLSSVAPSSLVNGFSTASVMSNGTGSIYNGMTGEGPDAGEKKHQCPHCPRAFARAYNLKTHIATHDPQRPKPYKCPYASCGRGFSRKHDLGRHVGSVHEKGERGSERGGAISERGGSGERAGSGELAAAAGAGGAGGSEKVWCDGCGRGWVKGMKSGCVCDERDRETGRVKWEDTK